jgi:hypothetical protein
LVNRTPDEHPMEMMPPPTFMHSSSPPHSFPSLRLAPNGKHAARWQLSQNSYLKLNMCRSSVMDIFDVDSAPHARPMPICCWKYSDAAFYCPKLSYIGSFTECTAMYCNYSMVDSLVYYEFWRYFTLAYFLPCSARWRNLTYSVCRVYGIQQP